MWCRFSSLFFIFYDLFWEFIKEFFMYLEKEEKFSSELRMKLGEAIVKSCRICGDILPHYTSLLLSALLTGVKDDDHLIRASSLSAIGDVCSLSKFSIGSISTEVKNVFVIYRVWQKKVYNFENNPVYPWIKTSPGMPWNKVSAREESCSVVYWFKYFGVLIWKM